MSRRKGRILAFQALYSYDVGQVPLEELLKFEWENDVTSDDELTGEKIAVARKAILAGKPVEVTEESSDAEEEASDQETFDFARILISGTINHLEEVDALIEKHLSEKWSMERINRVSLAVMRESVFALLYQKEVAPTIVIDEAVGIAKEFGEDGSFKFVNAILDNIKKEICA